MKKNKDFFKLTNVNHETWGVIHYLGFKGKGKQLQTFFRLISRYFICPKCRRHITEFLNTHLAPVSFDDSIAFHNAVNERIGKPIFGEGDVAHLREYFKTNFLTVNSDQFAYKDGLTGYYYVILLTFYHDRQLCYDINETFDYIFIAKQELQKITTFRELFLKVCSLPLDRSIFFEDNYENIRIEISTEDFKPYICD